MDLFHPELIAIDSGSVVYRSEYQFSSGLTTLHCKIVTEVHVTARSVVIVYVVVPYLHQYFTQYANIMPFIHV